VVEMVAAVRAVAAAGPCLGGTAVAMAAAAQAGATEGVAMAAGATAGVAMAAAATAGAVGAAAAKEAAATVVAELEAVATAAEWAVATEAACTTS